MQPAVQTLRQRSEVRPAADNQRDSASISNPQQVGNRSRRIAAADGCVLLFILAATALFSATWTPDWLAVDTAQTVSVARNIATHGEIATDIIYYEEHLQFAQVPVPQTVFPAGYPGLIAAVMLFGTSDVLAARIIVTVSFTLVPLLLLWNLRRLGLNAWWAAFLSLMWLVMQPMWWNAQGLQSELPFIACTLGAFACLLKSNDKQGAWSWLLAAGALTALACSIRYAGVFFALSVGLVLAFDWARQRTSRCFLRGVAFCVPPLFTLAAMFTRNASLVGDMKGGNNHLATKPLDDVLRTTWYSLTDLWGWSRSGLMNGEASELLLLVGVMSAVYIAVSRKRTHKNAQRALPEGGAVNSMWMLSVTYCSVSLACLFWLETTTSVGLCPRLLLPIIPFLLIGFAQILKPFHVRTNTGGLQLVPAALVLLAVVTGQIELWAKHHQPSVVSRIRIAIDELSEPHRRPSWTEIMELTDDRPVLCNECHCVSNVTQLPVVGLAHEMYTSREWNHDKVRELVDRFDVQLVLVFPEVFDEASESTRYFEGLLAGDIPHWLTPIVTEGSVRAYAVKPAAL